MATLLLLDAGAAGQLSLDVELDGGTARLRALRAPDSSVLTLPDTAAIPRGWLIPRDDDTQASYTLGPPADAVAVTVEAPLAGAGAALRLLGREFDVNAGVSATLRLRLPAAAPDWSAAPFAEVEVCGRMELDGGAGAFAGVEMCFAVEVDRPPRWDGVELPSIPTLRVGLPDVGLRLPPLRLPDWRTLRLPGFPFSLAVPSGTAESPVRAGWRAVSVGADGDAVVLDVAGAWVETALGRVEGDLHLTRTPLRVDPARSWFDLHEPGGARRRLQFQAWHLGDGCVAMRWTQDQLGAWLGLLLPALGDGGARGDSLVTLRLLWGERFEARLDWEDAATPAGPRTLQLPGFELEVPRVAGASLVVQRTGGDEWVGAVAATLTADGKVIARTGFGLLQGTVRELTPPRPGSEPAPGSLLEVSLSPNPAATPVPGPLQGFEEPADPEDDPTIPDVPVPGDADDRFTLVLARVDFSRGMPTFLRQCPALAPLDFAAPATLCRPSRLEDTVSIATGWTIGLNVPPFHYRLPLFGPGAELALRIAPELVPPGDAEPALSFQVTAMLKLGNVEANAAFTARFLLESMAFRTEGGGEIPFLIPEGTDAPAGDFMGLKWTFAPRGEPEPLLRPDGTPGTGRRLFTLVTGGSNFELRQAEGSVITADFTRVTSPEEPLRFAVRGFRVGPRGVSFAATVGESAVRLQGVNTPFRFSSGTLVVEESRIQGFTLAGTGTLPPALVGHAVVDAALCFGEKEGHPGRLELLSAGAALRGSKLLKCNETRFQFQVDELYLRFVEDRGYHFYFTLTGKARFVPVGGDDPQGPLGWLKAVEITFKDCPLTGDLSVLGRHVRFDVELPRKVTFRFLGAFEMEIRGLGFLPSFDGFGDGTPAMALTGQVHFADGGGDVVDARFDFHKLHIAPPAPGSYLPRIHCRELGVRLQAGSVFALEGAVSFLDGEEIEQGVRAEGFRGRGTLTIQGLPEITATFAFVRVQRPGDLRWVRAWFVYAEASRMSLQIPVLRLFLREVGLGFGYRYTLATIKAADQAGDVGTLIRQLDELAKRQGDLSRWDRWRLDLEEEGPPPWTVVMRGLIAQNSAAKGLTDWNAAREKEVPSLFLFDAVMALRSDLTFLMTARAWLCTNYYDFHTADPDAPDSLRVRPLLTGTVLLQPRRKRFLARLRSSEKPAFGDHPPVWPLLRSALEQSYFSATLLIEPGLFHLELGWPNVLRWRDRLGPLDAEFRGGAIFRVSRTEVVNGLSFMARGTLSLKAEVNLGVVGARLSAEARVAYAARYIGVIAFERPLQNSALYAGIGVEVRVRVAIEFWIRIKIGFCKVTLRFGFSFELSFTALVEAGVLLNALPGVRGTATVGLRIMGRSLSFHIHVGVNEGSVTRALQLTERFLKVGLEAAEVEALPGAAPAVQAAPASLAGGEAVAGNAMAAANGAGALAVDGEPPAADGNGGPASILGAGAAGRDLGFAAKKIVCPDYHVLRIPWRAGEGSLFILLPAAGGKEGARAEGEAGEEKKIVYDGFFPVPPRFGFNDDDTKDRHDFTWRGTDFTGVRRWKAEGGWDDPSGNEFTWKVRWDSRIELAFVNEKGESAGASKGNGNGDGNGTTSETRRLADVLRYAFIPENDSQLNQGETDEVEGSDFGNVKPKGDPLWEPLEAGPEDPRVQQPSEDAVETAVRGAMEQVEGSPYLRHDPGLRYEQELREAFDHQTTVYTPDGQATGEHRQTHAQHVQELRASVVQRLISDLEELAALPQDRWNADDFLALKLGVVFSAPGGRKEPVWLGRTDVGAGTILQVVAEAGTTSEGEACVFNPESAGFDKRPPVFERVRHYAAESTVAISWDLTWGADADGREQPEDHLRFYRVARQRLDAPEPAREFQVRDVSVLRRDANGRLVGIAPRFKFTDHFGEESEQELANMGAGGKRYLYTVTPVDLAGNLSARPLTVLAHRLPNRPPAPPADPELRVRFEVKGVAKPASGGAPRRLDTERPLELTFTDPPAPRDGSTAVGTASYRVVFRRLRQWPVGSWPADADTADGLRRGVPASHARVLPDDVVIEVPRRLPAEDTPIGVEFRTGEDGVLMGIIELPVKTLRERGVLPPATTAWSPDAWQVFLQAVSVQNVPSALVPVSLVFQASGPGVEKDGSRASMEWQPAHLEWPALPIHLPAVHPTDGVADDDFAAVPRHWPRDGDRQRELALELEPGTAEDGGFLPGFRCQPHPAGLRVVRLRWNVCRSGLTAGEGRAHAALTSGFRVYEFDADAHTAEVLAAGTGHFADHAHLFRQVQEVELTPADDLRVLPAHNLLPDQWEAWYPSATRRLWEREGEDGGDPRDRFSPWFSWRESTLEWPDATHLPQADSFPADPREQPEPLTLPLVRHALRDTLRMEVDGERRARLVRTAPGLALLLGAGRVRISGFTHPGNNGTFRVGTLDAAGRLEVTREDDTAAPAAESALATVIAHDAHPTLAAFLDDRTGELVLPPAAREAMGGWRAAFPWLAASGFATRANNGLRRTDALAGPDVWRPEAWCPLTAEEWGERERSREITLGPAALGLLHPFLARLTDDLCAALGGGDEAQADPNARGAAGIFADPLPPPPIDADGPAGFLAQAGPAADPYGWNALKRLGLASAFTLRDRRTGRLADPDRDVRAVLAGVLARYRDADGDPAGHAYPRALLPHLHVEWQVQPGRSVRGAERDPDLKVHRTDLLAALQLSLRPGSRQRFHLQKWTLARDPARARGKEPVDVIQIKLPAPAPMRVKVGEGGVQTVPAAEHRITIELPAGGATTVFLRCAGTPATLPALAPAPDGWSVAVQPIPVAQGPFGDEGEGFDDFRIVVRRAATAVAEKADLLIHAPSYLFFDHGDPRVSGSGGGSRPVTAAATVDVVPPPAGHTHAFVLRSRVPLAGVSIDAKAQEAGWTLAGPQELALTSPLAGALPLQHPAEVAALDFARFVEYVHHAFPPPAGGAAAPPVDPADWLPWLARFHDHGPDRAAPEAGRPWRTGAGPWEAAAYPRQPSPLPAAPGADGSVRSFLLVDDPWAHVFRYFVIPWGRYDRWWEGIARSALLFPKAAERRAFVENLLLTRPLPGNGEGGLDVVLDRVKPVAPPVVLGSRRLDPPPGGADEPDHVRTWEVIVARHPEQTLVERNRTVARQTQFRQVAWSLFRSLGTRRWEQQAPVRALLQEEPQEGSRLSLVPVPPSAVHALPPAPTAADEVPLEVAESVTGPQRSLALPDRMDTLGRGALVLQWDSPPHYYEHRLVLVAQALRRVSPPVEVVEAFFDSRSSPPRASLAGRENGGGGRHLELRLELVRYWDTTPGEVRDRWSVDAPERAEPGTRRPSSLPDLDVVYQLLLDGGPAAGVAELAAEISFDDGGFVVHADGARLDAVLPPRPLELPAPPRRRESDPLVLRAHLSPRPAAEPLPMAAVDPVPLPVEATPAWRRGVLADRVAPELACVPGAPAADALEGDWAEHVDAWFPVRAVRSLDDVFEGLPATLGRKLASGRLDRVLAVWTAQPGDPDHPAALLARLDQWAAQGSDVVKKIVAGIRAGLADGRRVIAVPLHRGADAGTPPFPELRMRLLVAEHWVRLREPLGTHVPDAGSPTPEAEVLLANDTLSQPDRDSLRRLVADPSHRARLDEAVARFTAWVPVSGRAAFPAERLEALPEATRRRLDLRPAGELALVLDGVLDDAGTAALRALAATADPAFRTGVEELIGRMAEDVVTTVSVAPGPEAVAELGGGAVTEDGVEWSGVLRPRDARALETLAARGVPGAAGLLAELAPFPFRVPGLPPAPATLPLRERLTTEPDGAGGVIARWLPWPGRLARELSPGEERQLRAFADDPGTPEPWRLAIGQLLERLALGSVAASLSGVPRRPTAAQVTAALGAAAERLSLAGGRLVFHGWMTGEEADALSAIPPGAADRAAVRRLFAASLGGGLGGATLRLRARRGTAPLADGVLAPFEELS